MKNVIIRVYMNASVWASAVPIVFEQPMDFDLKDTLFRVEDRDGKDWIFPKASLAFWTMEEVVK